MSQTDEYIERMQAALQAGSKIDKGELVKEVVSVFADVPEIKKGLNRYAGRVSVPGASYDYDDKGDLEKLIGKLRKTKEDSLKSIDDEYGTGVLSEHIEECDAILESGDAKRAGEFCYRMSSVYDAVIPGYSDYLRFTVTGGESDPFEDIPMIKEKLKVYRNSVIQSIKRGSGQSITMNASSSSSSYSSASVSVDIEINYALSAIMNEPEDKLSNNEKVKLYQMIEGLRSDDTDSDEFKYRVKNVIKSLGNKSFELVKAVLPAVVAAILRS